MKPGEKTELKVTFATANLPGPFEKIITIETDIPGREKIELFMVGTVKEMPGPKIAIANRKIDIGIAGVGEKKKVIVEVTNPGEQPLTITSIGTKIDTDITVVAEMLPLTVAAGRKENLLLVIVAGKPGVFNQRVMIESNAKNAPKTGFVIFVSGKAE